MLCAKKIREIGSTFLKVIQDYISDIFETRCSQFHHKATSLIVDVYIVI